MLKDNLKHYRAKTGLSQAAVAKKLFISQAAYAKYEVGRSMPSTETLLKICDLFKCNLEDLLSENETVNNNLPGKCIPLLSQVAAGIPIEANDYIDDETEYIEAALAKRGEYFALLIRGDSMEPLIRSGDVAIVRQQETIEDGEIGIVLINGNEGTCKRVKHAADGIVLISLNPAYAPMYYNKHDVLTLPVKIVGKVVETRRRFEKYKK